MSENSYCSLVTLFNYSHKRKIFSYRNAFKFFIVAPVSQAEALTELGNDEAEDVISIAGFAYRTLADCDGRADLNLRQGIALLKITGIALSLDHRQTVP